MNYTVKLNLGILMLQLIGVNLNSCQTNNSIKSYEVNVWLDYQIKYDYFIGGNRVLAPHNMLFEG